MCLFPRGAPHPPESTLAVSPELESILGVWLFLFATLQLRLGQVHLGRAFVFLAPRVLRLSLCQMGFGKNVLGFVFGIRFWVCVWLKQHEMLSVFRFFFWLVFSS